MDARQSDGISVLMFPWLAHGHISPFLQLAKKLSKRNFSIYFCSTPVNLDPIKGKLSESYSLSIQLVKLHLPSLPELPPQYHTTNGLPPHLMPTLKMAFDMASPNFSNILKTLLPDLLIYDFLQPWAPAAASSLNIPAVQFLSTGATLQSFLAHRHRKPGIEFPFQEIHLPDYEIGRLNRFLEPSAEEDVTVGPLLQDPEDEDEATDIVEWLNKKCEASAVFVSFGSEYFVSKEEMEEIAHGLELSNVDFIWVVRFPMGEKIRLEDALPPGFLQRLGDRGMVVEGWAPQRKILGHSSIGGFVSHCGWSSVMEGMKFGVPIIAMPMHLDQPINAKLVEAVGVGREVKRDENRKLEREEIAKVIKEVVGEKNGENVRRKARELSETLRKKGDEEIDVVVEELKQLCSY
ncbi:Beta-D-glucosyl crocetin beta-1,6-glucosyltransferase [Vitis vinifera]|uniref:Glycosyltransferase n=1 Tax=Vitis vinifera TaxID=29760 RepID=A0A438IBF7_VITVI|nr:Beta-D-glucosyl crocetin beta-1,6-glucosyltransferase [Vitis vinifera]